MSTFVDLFYTCIDQVWFWANEIYDKFGLSFAGILLAFIIVGAMVRYLIRPFIGSAGHSDDVKLEKASKAARRDSLKRRGYL